MAQQLLTDSRITNESLMILKNNLVFSRMANKEYSKTFGVDGAKQGDTLNIRKPARYIGRTGQALQLEDQTETSVPLQLSNWEGCDLQFSSKDYKLSMDMFARRVLDPAIATVAQKIDRNGLLLAKNSVANSVGTPGTPTNAILTYLKAGSNMDYEGCPKDNNRHLVLDTIAQATIVDALKGLFQEADEIGKQYTSGNMGKAAGFEWSMDQNIITHTVGTLGGTPTMSLTANQSGSSITTTGWTASVTNLLLPGDIFTIAGVYQVNPQNRQSTGQLRQFIVQSPVNSDGSGNATINILPAIVGPVSATIPGQYQNVSALPAASAGITMSGTTGLNTVCNLAYHRDAFTLGCADLPIPGGVEAANRVGDDESGLSILMVKAYDINMSRSITRLDVLYGWAAIYQELACQIRG